MTGRGDAWVADWVLPKLADSPRVEGVEREGSHGLRITRRGLSDLVVAAISVPCLDGANLAEAISLVPDAGFVVHVGNDGYVPVAGYTAARLAGIGVGSLGELTSVLNNENTSEPSGSKASFVLRSVRQHRNVASVQRVADVVYAITRVKGKKVTASMVYEYDVGADAIRTAIDRYPEANVLVVANPNAKVSARATAAAESAGVTLLPKWADFFSFLARAS